MKFTKMQGCGNDYVYVNGFTEKLSPEEKPEIVRSLSDRHFGIGGDGVIFINPAEEADFEMEMYNADGSRSEMCGNGIRCVAEWLYTHGISKETLAIDTLSGLKTLKMCVGYEKPDGTILKDFPPALEELADCKPIYEEFDGFTEDITGCKTFDELPEKVQSYIKELEKIVGCPVKLLGVGPGRDQVIDITK